MFRFWKRKTVSPVPSPAKPAQEKVASIQRPEVLNQLSEQDLAALYHVATIKHFQPDESILQEGTVCRELYIIMEGAVRLTDMHGIYNVTLHKGDFFGEIIWQERARNIYAAIASTPATVMAINYNMLTHVSEHIQLFIYKKLNHLSVNTIEKLAAYGRVAHAHTAQVSSYMRRLHTHTDVFITSEAFQTIIKNIPRLPKCAGSLAVRLLEDNISTKEVTEAVQAEPALAAALLRTVNSAYYGLQEKISSLHQAILYLGFNVVYQLILENSLKSMLPQDDEYEQIRLHSYVISLLTSEIASLCQKSKPLFNATVGILHDVGKIVTLLLRRKYPHIKDVISMVDESRVGACLLQSWEFPDNILSIIKEQSLPEFTHPDHLLSDYKEELAILYLAHVCYDLLLSEETVSTIFVDDYLHLLGLAPYSCQEFYELKLVPALLKNKKRLPDKIAALLQTPTLPTDLAFGRAS